jgi:hypothetical protein
MLPRFITEAISRFAWGAGEDPKRRVSECVSFLIYEHNCLKMRVGVFFSRLQMNCG